MEATAAGPRASSPPAFRPKFNRNEEVILV